METLGQLTARLSYPSFVPASPVRPEQSIFPAASKDCAGQEPNDDSSCGGLRFDTGIVLPYGIADNSVAFAIVAIKGLPDAM